MKYKYRLSIIIIFILLVSSLFVYTLVIFDKDIETGLPNSNEVNNNTTVVSTGWSESGGNLIFYNKTDEIGRLNEPKGMFWDVDMIDNGTGLLYSNSKIYDGIKCEPTVKKETCAYYNLSQLDMTSMEERQINSQILPRMLNQEPHDIDKISDNRYLVAGTGDDEILVVDENWDLKWHWSFKEHYDLNVGDSYPEDWIHLNDVEKIHLNNKTYYMGSARNIDSVVFVNEESEELNASLTLGSDDDFEILNRQHNPDFIPKERGGPAVLVADSENDRVIEYQRENGEWVESWRWSDSRMEWPRDADRLPNGNTLITDSRGNRVIEVDRGGDIVWSKTMFNPYEAERIGTGDESEGGYSADYLSLESLEE